MIVLPLAELFSLPALPWLGRSPAPTPKPNPFEGPDGDLRGYCVTMTKEQAIRQRDMNAAHAIEEVIKEDRARRFTTPLMACEAEYEIEKTYRADETLEGFIAGLVKGWDNENDVAVWRGGELAAFIKSDLEGKPIVVTLEGKDGPDEWDVPADAQIGWHRLSGYKHPHVAD